MSTLAGTVAQYLAVEADRESLGTAVGPPLAELVAVLAQAGNVRLHWIVLAVQLSQLLDRLGLNRLLVGRLGRKAAQCSLYNIEAMPGLASLIMNQTSLAHRHLSSMMSCSPPGSV